MSEHYNSRPAEVLAANQANDLTASLPNNHVIIPGRDLLSEFEKNERIYWSCAYTGKTEQVGETFLVASRHFGSVFAGGVLILSRSCMQ